MLVASADLLNHRSVAIGDRTVLSKEHQYHNPVRPRGKRIHRPTLEIEGGLLSLGCG